MSNKDLDKIKNNANKYMQNMYNQQKHTSITCKTEHQKFRDNIEKEPIRIKNTNSKESKNNIFIREILVPIRNWN